jgi:hypothetical protein
MTVAQDANKQGEAKGLADAAQDKSSQLSLTSEKDALGDKSLDDVSGGSTWRPFSTTGKGG